MRPCRVCLPFFLGAAVLGSCGNQKTHDRQLPPIIFISIDTLSARHTSLHGYPRETTPNLERLAESSVVFDRCTSNAPWTMPSYMSQFTGLYASTFSVRAEIQEEGESRWMLDAGHQTLAEVLAEGGYRTAAFIDNPNVDPAFGFDQGFQLFDGSAAEISITDRAGGFRHIAPRALAWLAELSPGEPYFLFVQALDVHGPYLPDEPWRGLFADDPLGDSTVTAPIALKHADIFGAIPFYIAAPLRHAGETELPVAPLVQAYDEGIRALDEDLGGFVRELEARGFLERAVLVVSADHGESLTQHDSFFDHQNLYQQDLHVPLVVRLPGGAADGSHEGRRISSAVQLVDLFPTLVELAGIDPLRLPVHGRSLVPLLRGEAFTERPLFGYADLFDTRSITVDGWKLIESRPSISRMDGGIVPFLSHPRTRAWLGERFPEFRGKVFGTAGFPPSALESMDLHELWEEAQHLKGPFYELYDLRNDPDELHDLSREEPERVARLLEQLRTESDRAEAARRFDSRSSTTLPPETLEELSKLGYASPK